MGEQKKNGCGCFKIFRYVMYLVCISILVFTFINDEDTTTTNNNNNNVVIPPVTSEPEGFYYEQLEETEKIIYEKLTEMAAAGTESYQFTNVDGPTYEAATERAVYAFEQDHPEYFWISNGFYYNTFPDKYEVAFMYYDYWDYSMDQQKYVNEVQTEVEKIASLANAYSTDYEKVIFVHDYLVQNAEYDYEALEESQKTVHSASSEYIYSVYGCLVNKKTVCAGYAKAYKMIMNELGIECIYVTGDAGEAHAWNQVTLDGENYYVDVTWDDADWKDYPQDSEYAYLCITDAELAKTHTLDETKFNIPDCTALTYNYYEYNDYILSNYDFNSVANIIDKQKTSKIVSVKFETKDAYQDALADLITNGTAKNISSLQNTKGSYYQDDDHYIITFFK